MSKAARLKATKADTVASTHVQEWERVYLAKAIDEANAAYQALQQAERDAIAKQGAVQSFLRDLAGKHGLKDGDQVKADTGEIVRI